MSAPLPIGDLAPLRARLAETTLADTTLPARLRELPLAGDKNVALAPSPAFPVEAQVKLSFEGKAGVFLFNAPGTVDPDGVLGADGPGDPTVTDQLPLLLAPSPGRAWLKYTISARVRSGTGLEALGFCFDLRGTVALADYRQHDSDRPLAEAVTEDLQGPARFAFHLDDVQALRPGEALSMRVGGALELSLEVKGADALAAGLGSLVQLLVGVGLDPPLGIQIPAGVRLRARIQVEDQFMLVFARDHQGHRIALRKASMQQRSIAPSVGLRVLLDPLDVSGLVDLVMAALPRPPAAELVPALRQQLEQRIEQVAQSRLTAGFGFEYARMEEQLDLLAVRASEAWLARHHGDFIRGRLQPVLDSIRLGAEGVVLERFLDRRTLVTERSWGLTLGLGRWAAGGRDYRRLSRVTRTLIDGRQARAYTGLTGYDGQLGGSRVAWTAGLRATTRGFAAGSVPRLDEYRFALALTWTCQEKRLAEDELQLLLDAAVLWNAVTQEDAARLAEQLRPRLGQEVEAVVQLALDDEVMRAIMRRAATAPLSAMAGPLAAAMPSWDRVPDRQNVYRRRELYSKLWAQYLADPQSSSERWSIEAEHQLARQFEATALGRLERQYQIARPYTFAGLIELNGGAATAEACGRFHQGLGALGQALDGGAADDQLVARGLTAVSAMFEQSHHVRAAGVYLLDGARATGLVRYPQRSLTVISPGHPDLVLGT